MNCFDYTRVSNVAEAVREISRDSGARFIAGGTNLLDLMKENVERPSRLIDITRLSLGKIESTENGGLRLGALVSNTDVAYDSRVEMRYPMLARAILSGASAQLRNMATTGGNLMQRTRCSYFYDTALPCNKREPHSGCSALHGFNRNHAILGASEQCIATHPSDMCVALAALDAIVQVVGQDGARAIPVTDFHRLPGETPHVDTNLAPHELIIGVELPANGFAEHSVYLKVRDRHSYAFALVSVAAALELAGGKIREARIALGGVAHMPWRNKEAEAMLRGREPSDESYQRTAAEIVREAKGFGHNDFKIELARRAIVRALQQAQRTGAAS